MGTNYYLYPQPDCECCGRPFEPLHIGKSSYGWHFSLHVMGDLINDLQDWQRLYSQTGAIIKDEYGKVVSPEEMTSIILEKKFTGNKPDSSWYAQNYAEPGLNGLSRRKIGNGCIRHGSGTYDCIVGEFS